MVDNTVKKFEEFLEEAKKLEIDGKGQIVKYKFLDYYKQQYFEIKCEVLSYNEKTATIKLLEFGKNGARPGTIMKRIKLSSLIGFKPEFPEDPNIEYEEEEEEWWKK